MHCLLIDCRCLTTPYCIRASQAWVLDMMESPQPGMDRETLIMSSLHHAYTWCEEHFGSTPSAWRWGDAHKAYFAPLFATVQHMHALTFSYLNWFYSMSCLSPSYTCTTRHCHAAPRLWLVGGIRSMPVSTRWRTDSRAGMHSTAPVPLTLRHTGMKAYLSSVHIHSVM